MASEAPAETAAVSAHAGFVADALALGEGVDRWSLAFALAALLWLVMQAVCSATTLLLVLSLLAAGMQKILALRVGFDRRLFARWAERWQGTLTDETVANDLAVFDRWLSAAGVRPSGETAPRDLTSRTAGALRLLRLQLLAFVVQFAASALAALIAVLPIDG